MAENEVGAKRREVLKRIGATTTGLVVTSSTVVASRDESLDVPDTEMVNELRSTAGNPDVLSARAKTLGRPETTQERSIRATEVRTENGTLAYARVQTPNDSRFLPGYFRFDSQGRSVPKQFRTTPGDTEVTLVYENGQVHPRRPLTEQETRVVQEAVDIDEEATMIYDDVDGSLFIISEEQGRFEGEIRRVGRRSYLHRPITPAFESGKYTLREMSNDEVSTQGDDCFDLFGPCPACIAGTATCAACGITCATGPQCAACLILTCGVTGGACGCCAICADGIPVPENVVCPD